MKNQDKRNLKRKASQPRCQITNKPVGNKPVVLCENAKEYVQKLGYSVEIGFIWNKIKSPSQLNMELRYSNG